ncbi:MAG: threonine/serine exporter family protein [Clostridium sp.]|nr:threonine/serine exporter family protein [Clostridium sp.]
MNDAEIFSLSLDIGKEIIASGGEIHRAKDTIKRINNAYGNSCQVFALPSVIIAQSNNNLQMRRIHKEDTDLAELSRLNSLSRRLCHDTNEEIHITKKAVYSANTNLAASCIATGSFAVFFGGTIMDAILAAIIGGLITYLNLQNISIPLFTDNLICAFLSAIAAYIPYKLGLAVNPDMVIIGTIMLLVPGLTVVNSIRDMMNGDLIAGTFELFNAIMSALAIAFGVAGGIVIMNWI